MKSPICNNCWSSYDLGDVFQPDVPIQLPAEKLIAESIPGLKRCDHENAGVQLFLCQNECEEAPLMQTHRHGHCQASTSCGLQGHVASGGIVALWGRPAGSRLRIHSYIMRCRQ